MSEEQLYNDAFARTMEAKKTYLQSALKQEELFSYETLTSDFHITDEQYEREILSFWKQYGISPEKFWFEIAGSRDKAVDSLFIPGDFYYCELIPYLNNLQFWRATEDKCYYDLLFPGMSMPRSVCRCMSGLYYDADMQMISKNELIDIILHSNTDLVIKPSIYSWGGKNIIVITPSELSRDQVADIIISAGANFIVQEKIEEHPLYKKIAEGGATTVRVISLLTDEGTYISSIILRVNPSSASFVAWGKGGYFSSIGDDNMPTLRILRDVIADEAGNAAIPRQWEDAPLALKESGPLPGIDSIRDQVRRMHPRLPHFRCIGWDFMVDKDGEAVFIEFNCSPGGDISQKACCAPMFGDLTKWVIEDYFHNRTLEKNQKQGLLVQ